MRDFIVLPAFLKEKFDLLNARAEALEARAADEDDADRRRYLFEAVGAMFEKANTYLAILQGVGYAGFFGIWQGARDYMTRPQNLWCVFLMGASLALFITWQVCLNVILARQQTGLAKVALAPPDKFKQAAAELQQDGDRLRARLARLLWPVNFLILTPGVAGMAVLLSAVARHLIETL